MLASQVRHRQGSAVATRRPQGSAYSAENSWPSKETFYSTDAAIRWPLQGVPSIGTAGRHHSESLVAITRCAQAVASAGRRTRDARYAIDAVAVLPASGRAAA